MTLTSQEQKNTIRWLRVLQKNLPKNVFEFKSSLEEM
jgi:hypothetical protein